MNSIEANAIGISIALNAMASVDTLKDLVLDIHPELKEKYNDMYKKNFTKTINQYLSQLGSEPSEELLKKIQDFRL